MFKTLLILATLTFSLSATDLYVGYSSKSNNFATVQKAVDKAKSINPKSESQRVTIHIKPGTYREQVVIQTPYVSLVNDESSTVTITWYYGIGYKYYSVGSDGRYNAAKAKAKSSKAEPTQRWGATVQILQAATDFKAKNIIFENSFNRYITKEEINDGVTVSGSQSITFKRTSSSDVKSKAATERAAAMTIDGNRAEFYNCKFYSSQDTLYTGASVGYFKKCKIQGNTDYIFGSGDYVFNQCELSFYGYSSGSVGGFITAARDQTRGYLFYNCKVTGNSALTVTAGYLGRPWRATAKVMFFNTVLANKNLIVSAGWTSMSGVEPTQATFKEYNTKLSDGTTVSLSSRKGIVISNSDSKSVTILGYLSGWTPSYL